MASYSEFKNKMSSYAQKASNALGIPVEVILAQWANESGNGTSTKAVKYNNYGGIKKVKTSIAAGDDGSGFAKYDSIEQFTQDYIRVMSLDYYKAVRAVGKTGDISATIKELGKSPYDAGHYMLANQPGGKLLNMLGLLNASSTSTAAQKKTTAAVCPSCGSALELSSLHG